MKKYLIDYALNCGICILIAAAIVYFKYRDPWLCLGFSLFLASMMASVFPISVRFEEKRQRKGNEK